MYSPIIGKKEYGDKSVPLFILLAKNEKVNSTHLSPSRFYFCTVDIFSFSFIIVRLELLLTAMRSYGWQGFVVRARNNLKAHMTE